MHNQVHIMNANNGHHQSIDCWCEPVKMERKTNKHGIHALVVWHDDLTMEHRQTVLANREIDRRHGLGGGIDALWITHVLDPFGNPPLLTD